MIKNTWDKNENASANKKEITVLKEHFPACFKEDGSFDIERFKEYLSEDINVVNEGYELKFLGKNYARLLVTLETETVIVPNEEHNQKEENKNSENIYITGDNLDGLKHLLKSYSGKVKCIYIDPPYNTGSDGFVYNDNFNFTIEELTEKLSIGEEQAQRILDLTKRGSASHSAWLMFMYPRLQLARDLLSDDGVIFISIDDNEQANLKLLCDDIYGEENFAGQIVVINNLKGRNDRANIATTHEYLLMYVSDKFISRGLPLTEEQKKQYKYIDENGNKYALRDLRKRGRPDRREDRPNMYFPIYYDSETNTCSLNPRENAIEITPKRGDGSDGRWRWGKNTVEKSLNILHPEKSSRTGKWGIKHRVYLNPALNPAYEVDEIEENIEERTSKPKSVWQGGELSTDVARRTFKELLPGLEFDYPKSVSLIKNIIHMSTEQNSYVLDFFSGSGTTMQAVLESNLETARELKFISIQLPEKNEKSTNLINEDSDQMKSLYTLDQIGMERIKKTAKKIKEKNPDTSMDLGFKHFTLKEPTNETVNKLVEFNPDENKLFADKTLLDEFGVSTVITTWLNNDGYGLTTEAEKIMFAGYEAYYKDKHLYLVHPELPNGAIEELVVKYETDGNFNPENIVLFGYSFTWTELESLKTNLKRLQDTEKNLRINFDVRY